MITRKKKENLLSCAQSQKPPQALTCRGEESEILYFTNAGCVAVMPAPFTRTIYIPLGMFSRLNA